MTDICKIPFFMAGTRRLVLLGGGHKPGHGKREFSPSRRAVTSPSTAHSDAGRETSTWPSQLLGTLGAAPAACSSAGSKEERARARASRRSAASCSLRSAEMSCVGRCGKVGVSKRVSEFVGKWVRG